jgi:hypothetical protein
VVPPSDEDGSSAKRADELIAQIIPLRQRAGNEVEAPHGEVEVNASPEASERSVWDPPAAELPRRATHRPADQGAPARARRFPTPARGRRLAAGALLAMALGAALVLALLGGAFFKPRGSGVRGAASSSRIHALAGRAAREGARRTRAAGHSSQSREVHRQGTRAEKAMHPTTSSGGRTAVAQADSEAQATPPVASAATSSGPSSQAGAALPSAAGEQGQAGEGTRASAEASPPVAASVAAPPAPERSGSTAEGSSQAPAKPRSETPTTSAQSQCVPGELGC